MKLPNQIDVRNFGAVGDGRANLKTGISMPQFFERAGRYFVCYKVNKEHILLDELPAAVMNRLTLDDRGSVTIRSMKLADNAPNRDPK